MTVTKPPSAPAEGPRPKLLMATHLVPYPPDMGCKGRMLQMLAQLARWFDVTLVSLCQHRDWDEAASVLGRSCKRFVPVLAPNKRSPGHRVVYRLLTEARSMAAGVPRDYFYANVRAMEDALREELRSGGPFEVVLVEYWYASEFLSTVSGPLKVVDTHDVDYLKNEEMRRNLSKGAARFATRIRQRNNGRAELKTLRRYPMILALTEADRRTFRSHLGTEQEIRILPTGVDTEYFKPGGGHGKPGRRVTFYGAMQGEGNIRAALHFHETVFPGLRERFPGLEYMILGAHPPAEIRRLAADPAVRVTGFVPDVRSYLEGSEVLVCPFQMGYGFRGRVLEAMALGVPVVSTKVGVQAVGLEEGEGVLLRDSPETFGGAVRDLLEDPSRARNLGRRGRQVVLERFSLEATYGRFARDLASRVPQGVAA